MSAHDDTSRDSLGKEHYPAGPKKADPLSDVDAHDGRVHSGLSGDNGEHQPTDSPAVAASLQPGHTADLGAAHDLPYDPMPSPAEAYANTGQADIDLTVDADANRLHKEDADDSAPSQASRSGVGRQQRVESNMEQPRGDGNRQREGDHDQPISGDPNTDEA